ncbi:hypothetical protein [Desertivirga brevis]|uniref:hypothetical protein n=1 Tax=Desertivirga brevis TaxID=2810310 RepID=UPI001A97301B|nr:hypothetical protein [Pedobacter sp. SYSU D00873]
MLKAKILFTLKDLRYEYDPTSYFFIGGQRYLDMPNFCRFNRTNRYEMVLLINALREVWGLETKEDCLKIERLIKEYLPDNIETQLEIADWLVLNWNYNKSKTA